MKQCCQPSTLEAWAAWLFGAAEVNDVELEVSPSSSASEDQDGSFQAGAVRSSLIFVSVVRTLTSWETLQSIHCSEPNILNSVAPRDKPHPSSQGHCVLGAGPA